MMSRFKSGAASFYIVAFSTLILVVIAMSFAGVVISQLTRTSNDDLAQSAYDSALAGIEDAKLAYYNYQSCIEQGTLANDNGISSDVGITCQDIVNWVEKADDDNDDKHMNSCDMVGHILGRIGKTESGADVGGVMIRETSEGDNSMQQAYTCVKISPTLENVKLTLSGENTTRVLQVKLDDSSLADMNTIKVSWGAHNDEKFKYSLYNKDNNKVQFPALSGTTIPNPPLLSVGIVQTTNTFSLEDFDHVTESTTDRGMVYLVPVGNDDYQSGTNWDNSVDAWDDGKNVITAGQIVKSNNRAVKNIPYRIRCNESGEAYICSAYLNLPEPYNSADESGVRSDDTFMLTVSSPYGTATDVKIEFCGSNCESVMDVNGEVTDTDVKVTRNMQIGIDSTGRANDLYRRVEARIESGDVYYPYPQFGVELLGDKGNEPLLKKSLVVTSEHHTDQEYTEQLNNLNAKR